MESSLVLLDILFHDLHSSNRLPAVWISGLRIYEKYPSLFDSEILFHLAKYMEQNSGTRILFAVFFSAALSLYDCVFGYL